MINKFVLLSLGLLVPATYAMDVAPPADQIASAILAAPKERRSEATVLGYNSKGEVITLRKGNNDLICLADNPGDKSFSVACYHKDLEPFMARGRELAAQGMTGKARHEMRWKEVQEGKVSMPHEARMLYVLTGSGYDAYARLLARHLPRHIAGLAAIVVQNIPGAGGLRAANYLYNVAPKDGLTIGQVANEAPFEPFYGNRQGQFDPLRYRKSGEKLHCLANNIIEIDLSQLERCLSQ